MSWWSENDRFQVSSYHSSIYFMWCCLVPRLWNNIYLHKQPQLYYLGKIMNIRVIYVTKLYKSMQISVPENMTPGLNTYHIASCFIMHVVLYGSVCHVVNYSKGVMIMAASHRWTITSSSTIYSRILYVEVTVFSNPWWRHQIETFSALLAICAGNSTVTGGFPTQRPVTWIFDVFFNLRLNKRLS